MKRLLFAFLVTTTAVCAETSFPGVENIMSLEEFHKTGLDQLTHEQITALNNAITKHYVGAVETQVTQKTDSMRKTIAEEERRTILQRFGLPDISFSQEWKEEPGLDATVTNWVGGNSFKLDNGQVWEGMEPIPYELVNRKITIAPRPNGQFALEIEGKNTTVRIRRVK
jgi:hypothetical protein